MKKSFAAMLLVSVLAAGCGTGVIYFEPKNGGPAGGAAAANFKTFDIDCVDGFEAAAGGGQTVMGSEAGTYSVGCKKDGAPMTAKVLGVFHAAPLATNKWNHNRAEVAEKARLKGCPAVAIRKAPPTVNQGGEAIGAFCVES
jgi:hypothetical protein